MHNKKALVTGGAGGLETHGFPTLAKLAAFLHACLPAGRGKQMFSRRLSSRASLVIMKNNLQKALVTGGAGFIGSHLVDALLARGHDVVVLDDLSTGKLENLSHVANKILFIQGSITDKVAVAKAMEGVDVVFHQAAVASVPKSIEDPEGTHAVNVIGTQNIFDAAKDAQVKRVVYASSCAVYGNAPELPKRERMLKAPASPYAEHKSQCEEIAAHSGVESVGLRYFNVFGPRQDPSSPYSGVISIFAKRLLEGEDITIYGDGETTRDFIFVSDVVAANIIVAEAHALIDHIFNVGTGIETSLNRMVAVFEEALGMKSHVFYEAARAGDIQRSVADIFRIQSEFGWSPTVSFKEGIEKLTHEG